MSGSTQGIGFAVARDCATDGAEVVLNGRTTGTVAEAVERLRNEVQGADVSGIAADLSVPGETTRLLDRLGEVDVLVSNVGSFDVVPFGEITDAEWDRYFQLNVMAGVRLARRLLPGMLERNRGRVIVIGTESAVNVPADMIHYGATKAAALAVANGLSKLTRGTQVTVNTVLGGPTYTDGVATTVKQIATARSIETEQLKSQLVPNMSLIDRFIDPTEIADLVAFLAGQKSSAINGAALRADGGVLPTII
ncbi:SDR family NAD(P)-dependent oxidoreductase [Brevibacterium sp. GP-SGM9]|uniref:SDR family NAD(P)-dependent oxidoreductase n=1 Tax=Brevibacterium sp. GP-SGM9 TaxID=3376990 RepID=UPI0039A5CDEB